MSMIKRLFVGLSVLVLALTGCSRSTKNSEVSSATSSESSQDVSSSSSATENYYTITWKNYNGQVLETDTKVKENTMPSYDGKTPAKPEDNDYTYTWTGWDPKVVPAVANVTYTATFKSVSKGTTIGTDGGQVNDENDDVSLNIPAGALDEETTITTSYIETPEVLSDDLSSDFLGAAEFGPSGTTFNKPVTVSINLTNTPKNSELAVFCYYEAEGIWEYVTDATPNGNKATFEVTHFSKYQVMDRTKDFLNEYTNIVRHAKANGLSDSEITEAFRDYLVNVKHIMDQYTTYDGYWYEPCGLKISGNYSINGKEGDPNDLISHEGKDNKAGNKYGLCQIDGATSSLQDKKNASENSEIIDVLVIVEYSIIKPDIELTSNKSKLNKGESATISIRCHYTNVTNFYDEYKDLDLAGYLLTITKPTNFTIDKTSVLTDSDGHASFTVTAKEDNKAETITVNFDVSGDFGTHAEGNITLNSAGGYIINGHIVQEISFSYHVKTEKVKGSSISKVGSFTLHAEYDFEGEIYTDDNEKRVGTLQFTNASASITSSSCTIVITIEDLSGHGEYDVFGNTSNVTSLNPSYVNCDVSVGEGGACELYDSGDEPQRILNLAGSGNTIAESGGIVDSYDHTYTAYLENKDSLLLDFVLAEGTYTNSSSSANVKFEADFPIEGEIASLEDWDLAYPSRTESTTQTITVSK